MMVMGLAYIFTLHAIHTCELYAFCNCLFYGFSCNMCLNDIFSIWVLQVPDLYVWGCKAFGYHDRHCLLHIAGTLCLTQEFYWCELSSRRQVKCSVKLTYIKYRSVLIESQRINVISKNFFLRKEGRWNGNGVAWGQ